MFNFSRSGQFYMKSKVFLKYFVHDCSVKILSLIHRLDNLTLKLAKIKRSCRPRHNTRIPLRILQGILGNDAFTESTMS